MSARRLQRKDLRLHPLVSWFRSLYRRLGLWALGHFISDALRSIARTRASSAFSIGIIAVSLTTLGAFLLVAENLRELVGRLGSLEVSVFLAGDPTEADLQEMRQGLDAEPTIESYRYVSREEALQQFERSAPQLAAIPQALGENPFPASFEITLTPEGRDPHQLELLAMRLETFPQVESVNRDLKLAERVLGASRVVLLVAAFLGAVLLLSALFTVANVVKLTVFARRDEVRVMRLVGSTSTYIRGTFVTEGILHGLAGATLGLLLLFAFYHLVNAYLTTSGLPILGTLTTSFLSRSGQLALLCCGIGLGALGSLLPLRRLARV